MNPKLFCRLSTGGGGPYNALVGFPCWAVAVLSGLTALLMCCSGAPGDRRTATPSGTVTADTVVDAPWNVPSTRSESSSSVSQVTNRCRCESRASLLGWVGSTAVVKREDCFIQTTDNSLDCETRSVLAVRSVDGRTVVETISDVPSELMPTPKADTLELARHRILLIEASDTLYSSVRRYLLRVIPVDGAAELLDESVAIAQDRRTYHCGNVSLSQTLSVSGDGVHLEHDPEFGWAPSVDGATILAVTASESAGDPGDGDPEFDYLMAAPAEHTPKSILRAKSTPCRVVTQWGFDGSEDAHPDETFLGWDGDRAVFEPWGGHPYTLDPRHKCARRHATGTVDPNPGQPVSGNYDMYPEKERERDDPQLVLVTDADPAVLEKQIEMLMEASPTEAPPVPTHLLLLLVSPHRVQTAAAWTQLMGYVSGEASNLSAAYPRLAGACRSLSGKSLLINLSFGDADGFENHVIALPEEQ